jgi:anti-sigma B factor antagonist
MIATRNQNNVVILDMPNKIEVETLQNQVSFLLGQGHKAIALNLQNLAFVESSGLGALVSAYKTAEAEGATLVLFNVQPYVVKLMDLTRLNRIMTAYPSEAAALSALES